MNVKIFLFAIMAVSIEIGGIHASPAKRGATPTKEPIPDFNDEPSYDPVRSDLIRSEIRGTEYLGAVVRALNFVVYEAAAPLHWEGAKAECAKKGGALASLTYDADIKKLMKYALNGNAWAGAWVGAKNPTKTQTTWKWLTGEPIPQSFPGWGKKQPNGGEDCLSLEVDGIHDFGCTQTKRRYVCQYSHV